MDIPYVRGKVARQAHVGLPEGTVEEEYAREGFFGKYAHLYRKNPPVNWTRIEGPMRPRAYELAEANPGASWLEARRAMFGNSDCRLHWAVLDAPMNHFFRNADGDEVLFVHEGTGRLETDFGALAYEPGDYLVIPRGTVYRLAPSSRSSYLVVEGFSEIGVPDRGMLGQHALFDPSVIEVPTPDGGSSLEPDANGEFELAVQRRDQITRVYYPHDPIDTVGWKGTLTVQKLNVRDIRPVASERYHLPPSAHTTFLGRGFVICSFLPRPLEVGDPTALKVPFYHSNIDYDEILFYHSGDFFSREGIGPAMLTFHPQGIHHGPQPGADERAAKATRTEEVAVMVDTRQPLDILPAAEPFERQDYWRSWGAK